jgi:hypothetical protein
MDTLVLGHYTVLHFGQPLVNKFKLAPALLTRCPAKNRLNQAWKDTFNEPLCSVDITNVANDLHNGKISKKGAILKKLH